MATTFTFEDDKELVQLAFNYVDAGTRMSWASIAKRIQRTGHSARALQERLRTLKKSFGADIRRSPQVYFNWCNDREVGHPGCDKEPPVSSNESAQQELQCNRNVLEEMRLQTSTTPPVSQVPQVPAVVPVAPIHEAHSASATPQTTLATPAPAAPPSPETSQAPFPPGYVETSPEAIAVSNDVRSLSGGISSVSSPGVPGEERLPPMSPSSGERAVTAIFADVPRELVVRGANKMPHRNAGELLPSGISTLLLELGGLDQNDIFLDMGNVVAQVALVSNVAITIGIEVRRDLYDVGAKMISKASRSRRLIERVQLVCQDIAVQKLATTPPYANATIVCLEQCPVIEVVKEELSGMFLLRTLVTSLSFCPRHRTGCHNAFCKVFDLEKVLNLPCSWKDDLQQIFVYKSL
ncbi:hypothetical protein PHMEG_00025652 [Phytophthora megakarya]|uniref:Uncharacterized protein n=1 Tax=Phytophthora megakarya TaxID=4795 RepID=A0A225VE36_9STRA|nr:hypothetical protein PHMEG_00025652 [Phytophthora megakarya]